MAARKWSLLLLALTLITLTILGGITAFIDPFFHYHAPLSFLNYTLDNQRYQNNGILKHFDYNAIIIGDSMTENFKASECNTLFDVSAVKTCFNGASLKELSDNLRNAIDVNPDIRMVVCGLNSWHLTEEQNFMRTDAEYPLYLYDSNPFNDVQYLLNKEVLIMHSIDIVGNTLHGIPSTTFDDYSSWSATTGKDAILAVSPRLPKSDEVWQFDSETANRITENLNTKIIHLAQENPHIQFYYFFPPYSVLYWDGLMQAGKMEFELEAWKHASRLLLEVENIHLFAFHNEFDITTNLDLYIDDHHHTAAINSVLLQQMAQGEHQLTPENYDAYWQEVEDFYSSYDYNALYDIKS